MGRNENACGSRNRKRGWGASARAPYDLAPLTIQLSREAAAAAAALHGVGVIEREAPLFQAVVEIEHRAVEEQLALAIDRHFDAVLLRQLVFGRVGFGVEAEAVLEAAATAADDAHAQERRLGHFLLGHYPLDFFGGFFGKCE